MSEHTFCPEHRSWFCPCVALWIYRPRPISKALAWFGETEDVEPVEWGGEASEEELDWDEQAAMV
jgi:hypothetical protein